MTQRAFLQSQEDRRGQLMFHSGLPQFDALAVDNDVFDPRLVRIAGMGIAEYGAGLASRDDVRRDAAPLHARRRREDEAPVLAVDLHFDLAVWILVGRFQDLAGDGERPGRVVSAPAVMGDRRARSKSSRQRQEQTTGD